MAVNVDIYSMGGIKLATGSATQGSATVSSIARIQDCTSPSVRRIISNWTRDLAAVVAFSGLGRNVRLVVTTAGAAAGRSWASKVIADQGTEAGTITLKDVCPYA